MSVVEATSNNLKANTAFLLASKPTAPANTKLPRMEKRVSDPSASMPGGRSYPIPSFFEYRAKPREYDFL
jgi:hypothetical protein